VGLNFFIEKIGLHIVYEETDHDIIINRLQSELMKLFKDFGLSGKFLLTNSSSLSLNESLRIRIELFDKIKDKFQDIGFISCVSDYIPRRLGARYYVKKFEAEKNFPNFIRVSLGSIDAIKKLIVGRK
jgi:hypothetical protein